MRDIPLQTPPGNYNPSWLRRSRFWLVLVVAVAASMYGCAWVVVTLGRPEPTSLSINIVTSDSALLRSNPRTLHHRVGTKDQPSSQEFELRNTSSLPVRVEFSLLARGSAYVSGTLRPVNRAAPDERLVAQESGTVRMTGEIYSARFRMEALVGLAQDGTIAPDTSARFRVTATSDIEQKDGKHFLILAVSALPDGH